MAKKYDLNDGSVVVVVGSGAGGGTLSNELAQRASTWSAWRPVRG